MLRANELAMDKHQFFVASVHERSVSALNKPGVSQNTTKLFQLFFAAVGSLLL